MRAIMLLTLLLAATSAVAQTNPPPAPPGAVVEPRGQAPVGARQPRPSDLPPESERRETSSDQRLKELDQQAKKAIQGICKGC